MPIQRPQSGECIFCAFRLQFRPPRPRRTRPQHGSFSTASRSLRANAQESPVRKVFGPDRDRGGKDWASFRGPLVRRVDYDLGQGKAKAKGNGNGNRITDGRAIDYAYDGLKKKSFKHMVLERLDAIEPKLRDSPVFKQPGMSDAHIDKALGQFRWYVRENVSNEDRKGDASHLQHKLFDALKDRGSIGLDSELQYALYNHFLGKNFSPADIENQRALADLRYPTEWFPVPRTMHRTIHAHIGPTNSGKTYHALKRLEQAKAGLYAGPLRLLAHEVYSRLNANGKLCALVTGEEQRLPEGWQEADSKIVAATVEMTSLNSEYDVAVIDEIQMLSSLERGFAWTQALLGLRSKEIHVCGELRALPVIRELAAAAGDKLVVHEYDRLTRLKMDESSLNGSFARLRKGDCIVTFSVVNIHALRTEVEKKTGKKVAVVYGSLPPETRAQQARLFNDPNNDYDYLIASDAVGMGLNLSIKRVIFEAVHKFHGGKLTTLSVSEIRQIAGRAGRYRTSQQDMDAAKDAKLTEEAQDSKNSNSSPSTDSIDLETLPRLDADEPASMGSASEAESETQLNPAQPVDLTARAEFDNQTIGLVTTIDAADFDIVKQALETEPPPLTFATLQPPAGIVQRFASYFPPGTPFSYILLRLSELSNTTHRYKIYHKPDMIMMADLIHGIEGLSTEDKMIFINAPAGIRDRASSRAKFLKELAKCIGRQRGGELLTFKHIELEVLDAPSKGTKLRLKDLEELHKGLVLYLWLSFRFPGVFTQRPLGNFVKELVEREIEETLRLMTFMPGTVRRERMRRRSKVENEIMRVLSEEEGMSRRKQSEEVAEAGFESPNGDDVLGEEAGTPGALAETGEQMPEDDEGEYPDEELADGKDDPATESEPSGEEVPRTTGIFTSWREQAQKIVDSMAGGSNVNKIGEQYVDPALAQEETPSPPSPSAMDSGAIERPTSMDDNIEDRRAHG